jgi:hypothetical protein
VLNEVGLSTIAEVFNSEELVVTKVVISISFKKDFQKPNIRESGAGIASTFCVFVAAMDVIYKLNYQQTLSEYIWLIHSKMDI